MYIVPYEGNGSGYDKSVVYVNLSFYEKNGDGVPSRYYFYIDEKKEIKLKLKSLAGSIFHEFCHGLHDVSETYVFEVDKIIATHKIQYAWDDDEELRTITCFDHDPICDHCFDFCQSILKREKFLPRYSHGGHSGIGELETEQKQKYENCISASQKFMDGWMEYVL
jgi:hypothetical protein